MRVWMELRECRLLEGLSESDRHACVAKGHRVSFKRGHWVARQGEPATAIYAITSGMLKLLQSNRDGEELIVRYVGPGGVFGGVVAVDRVPYPVSAITIEPTEGCAWDSRALRDVLDTFPTVRANIMREMTLHMTDALTRVREMTTLRVGERLALTLVRLARQIGRPTDEGILIAHALTRQELAELAGTTLYTASRTLAQWEEDGLLRSTRKQLLIRQPRHLAQLAGGHDRD